MTKKTSDPFDKWGEAYDWPTLRGRKGKTARNVRLIRSSEAPAAGALRAKLTRIVRRVPEVVVKISGNGKNVPHIKAHMDYISRHGKLELEDENGLIYSGSADVRDLSDIWGRGRLGIPYEGERRKESFNIVLSMPPGTPIDGLRAAAKNFAAEEFGGRQFAFALHDDKDHAHVHLVVKARDAAGVRLNPRKADLRRWREGFAERLREQGIEANASSRKARGVVRRPESQIVRQIVDRDGDSYVRATHEAEAVQEAQGGTRRSNPAAKPIADARQQLIGVYGQLARSLAQGDAEDKVLALGIVGFVRGLPATTTQHEDRVERLRAARGGGGKLTAREQETSRQTPPQGRDRS